MKRGGVCMRINQYTNFIKPTYQENPANSSINEKMNAQEVALDQGVENAEDGISLLRTGESALNLINDTLSQIKELAVQAKNGILSDDDRGIIQQEIDSLKENINNIAENTEFNTRQLLDDNEDITIQTNGNANQTINLEEISLETLGIEEFDVTGEFDLEDIDNAQAIVSEVQSEFGANENALERGINVNEINRENTLAARSRLTNNIEEEITEMRKDDLINNYRLQTQRIRMQQQAGKLNILG